MWPIIMGQQALEMYFSRFTECKLNNDGLKCTKMKPTLVSRMRLYMHKFLYSLCNLQNTGNIKKKQVLTVKSMYLNVCMA